MKDGGGFLNVSPHFGTIYDIQNTTPKRVDRLLCFRVPDNLIAFCVLQYWYNMVIRKVRTNDYDRTKN